MKHLRLDGTSPGPRFVEGPGDIPGVMVPGDPENKKLTLWLIGFPGVTKYSGWVAEVCYQDLGKDYGNTVYTLNLADAAKLEVRTVDGRHYRLEKVAGADTFFAPALIRPEPHVGDEDDSDSVAVSGRR